MLSIEEIRWLQAKKAWFLEQAASIDELLLITTQGPKMADFTHAESPSPSADNVRLLARPKRPLTAGVEARKQRVRGILAKVEAIVNSFDGPFDKEDVLRKLAASDALFAGKITRAQLRDALRQLYQRGSIEVLESATSTSCARYRRVA